ncbi:hypothetical protein vseg_004185 [Gypsophila vaccaria]
MGENSSAVGNYFDGFKGFWCDRFAFLQNYTKFVNRDQPLPVWTDVDIDSFIAVDPVHGPALKTAREAAKYGLVGSAVGAVTTAGAAWKYSKSPHGTVLALGAGAVFGWTFGHEIANHSLQLYKVDTMTAQTKFLEWWESKTVGRS